MNLSIQVNKYTPNHWVSLRGEVVCLFHKDFMIFKKQVEGEPSKIFACWVDKHFVFNVSQCTGGYHLLGVLNCNTLNHIFKYDDFFVNVLGDCIGIEFHNLHIMIPLDAKNKQNKQKIMHVYVDDLISKNHTSYHLARQYDDVYTLHNTNLIY